MALPIAETETLVLIVLGFLTLSRAPDLLVGLWYRGFTTSPSEHPLDPAPAPAPVPSHLDQTLENLGLKDLAYLSTYPSYPEFFEAEDRENARRWIVTT